MRAIQVVRTPVASRAPEWSEAFVALELGEGRWRLDDGRAARQALSCLVAPMAGDRVLVAGPGEGEGFVVHVLERANAAEACLGVPGARVLAIRQPRVEISATEGVAIRSMRDLELTAAAGVIAMNARNLFATVTESLVQNARHYVGRMGHYLLDVASLLRLHGEQALVTAKQDIKMDAERISMG